eukprot:6918223-Lingulodinium_polyedra.AAC.1
MSATHAHESSHAVILPRPTAPISRVFWRTKADLFAECLGAVRKREQMINAGVPLPRRSKRAEAG